MSGAHIASLSLTQLGRQDLRSRQICCSSLIQIKKPAPAMRLIFLMNANKRQETKPGLSPHLAELIEAADRKIKNYLLRQYLLLWHPISTAPDNHDLELKVLDGGSSVVLPFPCRRTNAGGWINADLETGVDIRPTNWRPWQKATTRSPRSETKVGFRHHQRRSNTRHGAGGRALRKATRKS